MATGTYAPNPVFTGWDDDGHPLEFGLLYTYAAGTTTPLATYSDVGLTVANANPIVLDAAGRATIFLTATSYKWILKNAAGVTVWTRDNIGAVPVTNIDNDVVATAGETLIATEAVYLSAGTWLKANASATLSSTLPTIAFVVADTATGAVGSVRLSGRMTGFSGLTPGSDYYVGVSDGTITITAPTNARYVGRADTISSLIITPNPREADITTAVTALVDPRIKSLCNGRLSLTTAVPITVAPVTAATTVKWVPYQGNEVALYSGTAWVAFALAELSLTIPTTANTAYDVFIDYNAGTPALTATAWTSVTARATVLTLQDGVYVLTGVTTKRYVGSFRTTNVAGQTELSLTKQYLWNYYHRVNLELFVADAATNYNYSTATIRQANGSAANQVEVFVGVQEAELDLTLVGTAKNDAGVAFSVGIGEDSTSTYATGATGAAADILSMTARLVKKPAIGHHVYSWNEWSAATGTTTFYATRGAAVVGSDTVASGLRGWIQG